MDNRLINKLFGNYFREFVFLIVSVILIFPLNLLPALGQELERIEIAYPRPVGSGARAMGMGNAFIAVADDATAASWNPGGLIQLEKPEMSIVFDGLYRTEDLHADRYPERNGEQSVFTHDLNYLSVSYPFVLFHRNMIVSLNYQKLYDFNRDWRFSAKVDPDYNMKVSYKQDGDLSAFGLAYAVQITPLLSMGATVNIWHDFIAENKWTQNQDWRGSRTISVGPFGRFQSESRYSRYDQYYFEGVNFNLGFLWNISPKWTVGAIFKTPFTADLKHDYKWSNSNIVLGVPGLSNYESNTGSVHETIDMPMAYGLGLSYRLSDEFTVSTDFYKVNWSEYVLHTSSGRDVSPISGRPISEVSISDTYHLRIGAEYLWIGDEIMVPLRGGLFYDPAPAEESPENFYGFSLGSGLMLDRYILDFAYSYRFGNESGKSILNSWGFSEDVEEHLFYTSLIIHF